MMLNEDDVFAVAAFVDTVACWALAALHPSFVPSQNRTHLGK